MKAKFNLGNIDVQAPNLGVTISMSDINYDIDCEPSELMDMLKYIREMVVLINDKK